MADQEQTEQQNNSATTEENPVQSEAQETTEEKAETQQEEQKTEEPGQNEQAEEQTNEGEAQKEPEAESADKPEEKPAEGDVKEDTPKEGEEVKAEEGGDQQKDGEQAEAAEGEKPEGEAEAKTEETTDGQEPEQKPEGEEGAPAETPAEGGEATDGAEEGAPQEKPAEEGATEGEQTEGGEQAEGAPEGEEKKEGEGEEGQQKTEGEETSKSPVPQSDTFAEGERAESPVGVGEKLSREGSPTDQVEIKVPDKLEPGTPERSRPGSAEGDKEPGQLTTFDEGEEDEEEEEEEEEEEQPEFDRDELIERYHQAIADREQLQQQNYQLQHKLAEYFRKKKADESRQEYDKNVTDQEQRYLKYMAQLEDLRRQDMQERDNYKHQITDLKSRCEERKERVDEERLKFMEFKKQVALNALNSRSGRPIPPKDIESYLAAENRKESEVVNVRLENIKLKNKLKKKEHQLKSKEELAEGLHLIDFEQLKIENQTYNEKIEERNEELLKLRKKITSTVQVLTHLKEKLQYVQAENQVQKRNLRDVESEVAQKRDILSRTKQARDALRIDNQRLRQNCGLLGNESLLRDFEERKDEGDDLRDKLERLKMQHAELTLHCNQVRRKIEQARTGRA